MTVFHSTIAAVTRLSAGPWHCCSRSDFRRLKNIAWPAIARLTFVQAGMHAAAQFNTSLQPVRMNSVRSIRPAAQGHGQSVLARVAAGACAASARR
nr:hypothetical protein [Escherichia coli O25b:H4-ST131]